MEIGEDMCGYFEGDVFVFTHATISKLCILGDKHEPCFEGSNIVANYSLGYNLLADEVQEVLGKKYYVLNNSLVEKEELLSPETTMGDINTDEMIEQQVEESVTEEATEVKEVETEETAETAETVEQESDTVESSETAEVVELAEPAESANAGEGAMEPAANYSALNDEIASLKYQLAEKDARISELEQSIANYKVMENEKLASDKRAIIASYASLLTPDEIKPVEEAMSTYSLEEVENKLALTYVNKQREAMKNKVTDYQLNVNSFEVESDSSLPDFFKQAMIYDKQHNFG